MFISDHTTFTFEFDFPDNPIKSCLSDFSKIDLISINNMPYSYNLSNLHRWYQTYTRHPHAHTYTNKNTHTHTYIHNYTNAHTYTHTNIHIHTHTHILTHKYIHKHIHT